MDAFETYLRVEFEPLTYLLFFGSFFALGLLELIVARDRSAARRRQRWPVNLGLTVLNIMVLSALPVTAIVAADFALDQGIGLLNGVPVGAGAAIVIGILARSLLSWAVHLAMHKLPLLWRFHRVHHTDTHLDVTSTVRFHPMEFVIGAIIQCSAIVGLGLSPLSVLIYELFDAVMAVFSHANIRLPVPVDRALRFLLVTPDMHRIHHSADPRETDSNYSATIALWDHLFGTHVYRRPDQLQALTLGLGPAYQGRSEGFLQLLTLPLRSVKAGAQVTQPAE